MITLLFSLIIFILGLGAQAAANIIPDVVTSDNGVLVSAEKQLPEGAATTNQTTDNIDEAESRNLPDTTLVTATNNKSGVIIEKVAAVAVKHSQVLAQAGDELKDCACPQASTSQDTDNQGFIVGSSGGPGVFDGDLRDLPIADPWEPGDPIIEAPIGILDPDYR